MKKITLRIGQRTKQIMLGLAVAGMVAFGAMSPASATTKMSSMAFIGFVASFKKKGVELDAEELKQFTAMDAVFEENLKGLVTAEALKTQFDELKSTMSPDAIKKLTDQADEINEALAKQALAIDHLKTLGNPAAGGNVKSLKEQIKEELGKTDRKEAFKKFKEQQVGTQGFTFEVKAAGTMTLSGTTAYVTAGTNIAIAQPEFIPGLNDVARNQPFILPLLNVVPTTSENIVYVEKYNPQGAAAWVGEGVAAPEVSFDIKISNSRAKLVTAYIKVSTEMLEDLDYIASEIEKELMYQVAISIDTFLLQGDGTGDNLKGIKAFAPAYTLTSLTTTLPNNCDAVLAAATQIVVANFAPDIAVMNPIDFAQTKLLKGTTGYYIVNPNNSDATWANIRVVQSNQVPVGYLMVMDSRKTNVQPYMNFNLSYGWVNDDFIKRLVTIQGTQRMHSYIKVNDVNAFVYDTLANIKTAITAV